jgi:hypothetical protein
MCTTCASALHGAVCAEGTLSAWDVGDGLCLASMPRMLEEYAPTCMVCAVLIWLVTCVRVVARPRPNIAACTSLGCFGRQTSCRCVW